MPVFYAGNFITDSQVTTVLEKHPPDEPGFSHRQSGIRFLDVGVNIFVSNLTWRPMESIKNSQVHSVKICSCVCATKLTQDNPTNFAPAFALAALWLVTPCGVNPMLRARLTGVPH